MKKINLILKLSMVAGILLMSLAVACYFIFFSPQKGEKTFQEVIQESQEELIKVKKELEQKNTLLKEEKQKTIEKKVYVPQPQETTTNDTKSNEIALLNYKIDSKGSGELIGILFNVQYSSGTEKLCSYILNNKFSRSHTYYTLVDELNDLENEYGKYKNTIPYINNDLSNSWNVANTFGKDCVALGYNIGY